MAASEQDLATFEHSLRVHSRTGRRLSRRVILALSLILPLVWLTATAIVVAVCLASSSADVRLDGIWEGLREETLPVA